MILKYFGQRDSRITMLPHPNACLTGDELCVLLVARNAIGGLVARNVTDSLGLATLGPSSLLGQLRHGGSICSDIECKYYDIVIIKCSLAICHVNEDMAFYYLWFILRKAWNKLMHSSNGNTIKSLVLKDELCCYFQNIQSLKNTQKQLLGLWRKHNIFLIYF